MSHARARTAADLRDRIARILAERVSDPRLAAISVIEVDPSPDGSFARVFYRSLDKDADLDEALQRAKPFIRRCLGEGLRMRRVPELDFRYDPAEEHGARVDAILEELSEERGHEREQGDG